MYTKPAKDEDRVTIALSGGYPELVFPDSQTVVFQNSYFQPLLFFKLTIPHVLHFSFKECIKLCILSNNRVKTFPSTDLASLLPNQLY